MSHDFGILYYLQLQFGPKFSGGNNVLNLEIFLSYFKIEVCIKLS